jgi:LuxR family maltose regulon positive regulatory protein
VAETLFHSNAPIAPGNQSYLERPHIRALMEKAIASPLVTVVAGAGYGKTYSVYSYLHSSSQALTMWLQLSEQDNLGWRFWENFVQAVSIYNKDLAANLAELGFPDTRQRFDRYADLLRRGLKPGRKRIIVYDDFHYIRDTAVLHFVERSANTIAQNITIIIISRNEPPFNTMALFSKGLLVQISQENLRFSREELVDYFSLQGVRLNPGEAADLYHDTEGWAFAIYLAALAFKKNPAGAGYARSSMKVNIFKLIEGEIAAPLSPALRKLLIKLSLIEHRPPELIAELAGGPHLPEEIKNIESFIRFDPYSNSYQIHHLFLEYLTGKQGELGEETKRDVFIRAALWCINNNMKLAAIGYYEKAGAYQELIDVIYTLPLAVPDTIAVFLLDILERAPEDMYKKSPIAWILKSRFLFTLAKFEESAAELRRVIARFEALELTAFTSRVLYAAYNHLGFIGMLTALYATHYDFAPYFAKAHEYYPRSGNELQGPTTIISLSAYVCRVGSPEKGKIEEFIAAAAAAIPHLAVTMNGCGYGMDDLARCELAFFRADLDQAERFGLSALHKGRERNQYEIENRALFYLMRTYLAQGKTGRVEELRTLLEAELKIPEYLNRYIYYDIVSSWIFAQLGQPEKIAPWLKSDFYEKELNSLMMGMEIPVRTKWYISEKRYAAALAALESQGNRYGHESFLFGKLCHRVMAAVCFYRMGEKQKALEAIESAYILAAPNGLDMFFIEQGKDMRTLMGAALKDPDTPLPREWLEKIRRQSSSYAKRLFAAAEYFRVQRPGRQEPAVPLSRREMEVLTGLSRGLTREEIAEDRDISINTVKSAIKSVYNKLGAVNRADAIRIATALHILKSGQTRDSDKKV